MNLKDIKDKLEQFNAVLEELSNIDFVSQLIDTSHLSKDDLNKLELAKKDPRFLELIDKKATKEEIEEYVKGL